MHQEDGWCQDNLKAQACKALVVDAELLQKSCLNAIAASEDVLVEEPELPSMEEALPHHVLSDIINRVEDARDLANCMATSKSMNEAVSQVRTLTLICKKQYYDLARKRFPVHPCSYSDSEDDDDEEEEEQSEEEEEEEDTESENEEEDESENEDCCEMSKAMSMSSCGKYSPPHCRPFPVHVSFKNACLNMLRHVDSVEELRIEVDQEMQGNMLLKEEIHMVDFWLSEPMFVRKWVSECRQSLKHLTLVDYGQQAIMRQSPIVRILSETCPHLESLELRNMYLDTSELLPMPHLRALTLRCIKMTEHSLSDLNSSMPSLFTLALVSVFGIQVARLSSPNLQVLCLGLSTSAKIIDLHLPNLHKLQLKMTCPDSLLVNAPQLAYVAVCMENRDHSVVSFQNVNNLKELLFGASHFATLSSLMRTNPYLEKLFLDVPCMALGEDGKWEGVLKGVPLRVPDIAALKENCPSLHTLSVGPGLWHALEQGKLQEMRKWPELKRLVVHVVVVNLETCVEMVKWIVEMVPTLLVMEIYVHEDSPVKVEEVWGKCRKEILIWEKLHWGMWRRSLNFQCFSF